MLPVNQTQTFTSTYTADVSGVCSALYELGGMCVMHDASGCNSTYHTHDEPRWYDQDSLVFISALSELEAVMGDDGKLIGDIAEAAAQLHPRFVAIAGTPIPMMTGCDLPAIAAQVEAQTGIPAFGFDTNGMHSYVSGAGMALAAYARRMIPDAGERPPRSVNILGATPLDFSVNGSVQSMGRVLEAAGWQVLSTWAMGSTPKALDRSGQAQVNLVVSSVGLPAARVLRERFGTPYVVGTPFGENFTRQLLSALEEAARSGGDSAAFSAYTPPADCPVVLIGESVTARSLALGIKLTYGTDVRVLCPLESTEGILSPADLATGEEDAIQAALRKVEAVIADPLYRPILPPGCRFHPLPHEAFSGRIFRKSIPNLIEKL